jgi:hypothetical protein
MLPYLMFYVFATVIEGKRGLGSFASSFSLVRGRWWAVLARMMFLGVVAEIIYFVLVGIALVLSTLLAIAGIPSAVPVLISIIMLIAVPVFIMLAYAYEYRTYTVLRQNPLPQNETEKIFKRWTVAFLVVGVIAVILIAAAIRTALPEIMKMRYASPADMAEIRQAQMMEIQRLFQNASSTMKLPANPQ